jgi:hypothetical protein
MIFQPDQPYTPYTPYMIFTNNPASRTEKQISSRCCNWRWWLVEHKASLVVAAGAERVLARS